MIKTFFAAVVLFLSTYSPLFADEVMIYGIEIPGLHQSDGMGAYDQTIDEAVVTSGEARLVAYPPDRARYLFETCQNCCLSPANKNQEFYKFGDDVVQSEPMNTAKIYIFVNQGEQPIHQLEELRESDVGLRRGMPYGKSVETAGLRTVEFREIDQGIKMLQKGRIDAFISYVPDAYNIFRKLGIEPYPHDVPNPVAVHSDSLVCRGVEPEFIATFNQSLRRLDESGRLKSILGHNYLEKTVAGGTSHLKDNQL